MLGLPIKVGTFQDVILYSVVKKYTDVSENSTTASIISEITDFFETSVDFCYNCRRQHFFIYTAERISRDCSFGFTFN
jgi:uncharacterized protein YydD (DUF2326 family)